MKKFGRIYLISYALIMSVICSLFAAKLALPSDEAGNENAAICFQDARDEYGIVVLCQSPMPEWAGTAWTMQNIFFVVVVGLPLDGLDANLRDGISGIAERFVKDPLNALVNWGLTLAVCSPHLLALILVIRRIKARVRGSHGQPA